MDGTAGSGRLTADYVIVGAGTAGCVLARRLSDDGVTSVVLVEAGRDVRPDVIRTPDRWTTLTGSEFDWGYRTDPQRGLDGQFLAYPRGRIIGGSSSINAMMHMRALEANFDAWVAGGATQWSYERLLPFMDMSEDPEGGGIFVAPTGVPSAFALAVERAMAADARLLDLEFYNLAIRDGERVSAADGYLDETVRARPNLTIVAGTTVRRLVFEGTTCVGIEAGPVGATQVVRANREVVLAAGAIGSPQLLLLSGIGKAHDLHEQGIAVLVDAPEVGEGLQDHVQSGLTFSAFGGGPPWMGGRLTALMFSDADRSEPDLQFNLVGIPYHVPTLRGPEHGFTLSVGLMKPDSRGRVRLAGNDVDTAPHIDPDFLGAPADVARLVGGLRVARELIAAAGLDAWDPAEVLPGPQTTSDTELAAYVRASAMSYYHPVGTCRLGGDDSSVVDQELRVRGVSALRVVDASVMPSLTSQNINPTVYAIAEAAAAMITADGIRDQPPPPSPHRSAPVRGAAGDDVTA